MPNVIEREQTARQQHQCVACPEPIKPGERYVVVAIPPWLDYEADVDDEGRMIGFLRDPADRQWTTMRYHMRCDWR